MLFGLIIQILAITLFAALVIFRIMGKDYDAAWAARAADTMW